MSVRNDGRLVIKRRYIFCIIFVSRENKEELNEMESVTKFEFFIVNPIMSNLAILCRLGL